MLWWFCLCCLFVQGISAFAVHPSMIRASMKSISSNSALFATKPEEDPVSTPDEVTSFDQAGSKLIEEQDQKRMESMGDFDSNPAYQSETIAKMRAAIQSRTQELGIEKSKVSAAAIEQAQKAAAAGKPIQYDSSSPLAAQQQLDLTRITQDRLSSDDENLPSILYNPDEELTDEEKAQADPVGQLSIWEQALSELKQAKWPDLASAFREVLLMAVVVAVTAFIIINWDTLLREFYTNVGFIPRPEEVGVGMEGTVLPEGWTNNMSEQDIANLQEEFSRAVPSLLE